MGAVRPPEQRPVSGAACAPERQGLPRSRSPHILALPSLWHLAAIMDSEYHHDILKLCFVIQQKKKINFVH